jgi:hypothetical protein
MEQKQRVTSQGSNKQKQPIKITLIKLPKIFEPAT